MRHFYLTVFSLLVINAFGQTPEITLDQTAITASLEVGATVTRTFTITNTGNRDLTWELFAKGEPVTFTKKSYADYTLAENQDRISDQVWITRQNSQGLYNIAREGSYASNFSPDDTEWAYGNSIDLSANAYEPWQMAVNNNPQAMIGQVISMHAITDNRYFDIVFDSFAGNGTGGGFSYTRTEYFLPWVSASADAGTLLPGASTTITVTFDGASFVAGGYNGYLTLVSNASDPEVALPFALTVTGGIPDIDAVSPFNMGNGNTGYTKTGTISIQNTGDGILNVSNITSTDAAFVPVTTTFSVNPGEAYDLEVTFQPTTEISYSGQLSIESNDPDENPFVIDITGDGVEAPAVVLDNTSFSNTLASGSTGTSVLNIANNGGSDLEYSIAFNLGTSAPVTFTKNNYDDPTLPQHQDRISGNIWITRNNSQGLFNAAVESIFTSGSSPANTAWSTESTAEATSYTNWRNALGGDPGDYIGVTTSMHATLEDRYFDITLSKWQCCADGGAFSYTRQEIYNWVTTAAANGTIISGANQDVTLNFNAQGLPAGSYSGTMVVTTNDPLQPSVSIPVTFEVTGAPVATVAESDVDFGTSPVGIGAIRTFHIVNDGPATLDITGISSSDAAVSNTQTTLSIPAFGVGEVTLNFMPTAVQAYTGNITFSTNDTGNPTLAIPFTATGGEPGNIVVTNPDMTATVETGNTVQKVIRIENTGAGDLDWSIHVMNTNPVVTFVKSDYADWTLEENQGRISDNVWITRQDSRGIYNIASEDAYAYDLSPKGTLWQSVPTAQADPLAYEDWGNANGYYPPGMIGEVYSMYAVEDREYYDITVQTWTDNAEGGGFSYERQKVAGWIKADAWDGTLTPGTFVDVTITYDPGQHETGTYQETIVVESNDADAAVVQIPVQMNLQGAPVITTSVSTYDFGVTGIGFDKTFTLQILNEGTDVLNITNIVSTDPAFAVSTTSATVNPGASTEVVITFTPTAATLYAGTVTISNNDPDATELDITLAGEGILVPDIAVTPEEIVDLQPASTILTGEITIQNTGAADLNWTAAQPDQSLSVLLSRLNSNYTDITNAITGRYDFAYDGGANYIGDGGNDMFDGGNYLNTDLSSAFPYSDNAVVAGDTYFGATTEYFTRHLPGLFVMAADLNNISTFSITGNNGADGSGSAEAKELEITLNGVSYSAFVKRVYNASDPSINQVMIIEKNASAEQVYATDTDDNFSGLNGINASTRIFYLLYATSAGSYSTDATVEAVVVNFLKTISGGAGFLPTWITLDSYTGTIATGGSAVTNYTIDLSAEPSGVYDASISIASNDPDEPFVSIHVQISNGAVVVVNPIPDVLVNEGVGTHAVDFSDVFLDANADVLSFIGASSNVAVATSAISGTTLTLTETGTGTSIISIRADDGDGSVAFADFNFRVNDVPDVVNPIGNITIARGTGNSTISITGVFTDSDAGDVLSLSIANSNTAVVAATLNADNIQLSDLAIGSSTVTLTANDGAGGITSTSFTVTVEKQSAIVAMENTSVVYTGQAQAVTVTTTPANLTVDVTYTLNGTEVAAPVNAGEYAVSVAVNDEYYSGTTNGTFVITKAPATIALANTSVVYSGLPQSVTFTTTPADLTVTVVYTLNGTEVVAPTNAGEYQVTATVNETNYAGTSTETFTIAKADQTIEFAAIADMFNSAEPFTLSASASSGLAVTFSLVSGPVVLENNLVTLTEELGEVTLEASQAGNDNFNAAITVARVFNVIQDPILSSDDPMQAFIEVYPVPARDIISISTGTYTIKSLRLIDSFGRSVVDESPNGTQYQLDVRNRSNGVYMLQIQTEKGMSVRRVLIRQ